MQLNKLTTRSTAGQRSRRSFRAFASAAPVSTPAPVTMDAAAKARARASILGGLVADAATMPLHWIYDVPKITGLLSAEGLSATPEFFPTPSCTFYEAKWGNQSPYGAELVPLLRSVAGMGSFDAEDYSKSIVDYFTSCTAYRNASIKNVITSYEAGKRGKDCGHATDFQANCFAKAPILVAKYGGSPDFLERTEEAIRVQQNNDDAVRFGLAAARLLERVVVYGDSTQAALEWAAQQGGALGEVRELITRALDARASPIKDIQFEVNESMSGMMGKHSAIKDELAPFTWAVWCNGPACGNPAAFTNVAMTVASYGNYVDGVRANLLAGGDNCSRSCLIGAMLGAQGGMDAIPTEWRSKTAGYAEYETLVDKLLA